MTEYRDEFTDLLGAYALDAVDAEERRTIATHLLNCHWCNTEVFEHREIAALLAQNGADAPEGVWDLIAAELSPPAPPMRLTVSPPVSPVPAAASAPVPAAGVTAPENVITLAERRSVRTRTMLAALSVAALLLAVVGFVAVDQRNSAENWRERAVNVTTPGPGDLTVELEGEGSNAGGQAVVNPDGRGYLVSHDLPDPGRDRLYQLWGQVDNVVLSLGTFDGDTDVVNFQVDPNRLEGVQAFAVTAEVSPGVLSSQNKPVLIGEAA